MSNARLFHLDRIQNRESLRRPLGRRNCKREIGREAKPGNVRSEHENDARLSNTKALTHFAPDLPTE